MKAVFKRADLALATNVVHNTVNYQTSLPILSNILVKVSDSKAIFMASDLECNVRCEIPAEVETPGSITVPARTFTDIVRVLSDADVTLQLEGNRVRVKCETLSYDLVTMDPEDFPAWPEMRSKAKIELPQKTLKRVIEQIIFCIPQKDPRRVLLGGFFDLHDKILKCVATDGKKLAFVQTEVESRSGQEKFSAIIPQKVLAEVCRTLGDEGNVTVQMTDRQVAFDLKQIKYVSNVIDGTYPNYDLVIPRTFERTMQLPRGPLRDRIRQAAVMSDEKSNSIILDFEPDELRLSAMTYDVGSYAGSLAIQYSQDPFKIVFNHKFISEILDAIPADEVVIKANKATSPAVFSGKDIPDTLYVIMPIKLADLAEPEPVAEEAYRDEPEEEEEQEE
ncbi:MAG: DNA polymerase III subunit beta [Candidatus Sumerlaeia bacterium]|nr:DNA polymerase III subunit beta [Candidatus Sumerlaeia bacterium]